MFGKLKLNTLTNALAGVALLLGVGLGTSASAISMTEAEKATYRDLPRTVARIDTLLLEPPAIDLGLAEGNTLRAQWYYVEFTAGTTILNDLPGRPGYTYLIPTAGNVGLGDREVPLGVIFTEVDPDGAEVGDSVYIGGVGRPDEEQVIITVTPSDEVYPTAFLTADGSNTTSLSVSARQTVQFNGSASYDLDVTDTAGIVSYHWDVTPSALGAFDNAIIANPTFTVGGLIGDDDVDLIVTLTVTDDEGYSGTDQVTLNVNGQGDAVIPTVDVTATSVRSTYFAIENTAVTPTACHLDVTTDGVTARTYPVGRRCLDPLNPAVEDEVVLYHEFTTSSQTTPRRVNSEALISLNASASYDTSATDTASIVSYNWTYIGATYVDTNVPAYGMLSQPLSGRSPSFTAPKIGGKHDDVLGVDMDFKLTVTDNDGSESAATYLTFRVVNAQAEVQATGTNPYAGVIARAGPDQTVRGGDYVELDGSKSPWETNGNHQGIYRWSADPSNAVNVDLVRIADLHPVPRGSPDNLIPGDAENSLRRYFFAPLLDYDADPLELVFTYSMEDDMSDTDTTDVDSDSMTVTVQPPFDNVAPEVVIEDGDREVVSDAEVKIVTLDGSGSSDDSGIVNFEWSLVSSTDPSINDLSDIGLSDPFGSTTTFTAPALEDGADDVVLNFALTVTDELEYTENGIANKATEQVTIRVLATADAGNPEARTELGDRVVASGTLVVQLDGSPSIDNVGIDSYEWTLTEATSDGETIDPGDLEPAFVLTSYSGGSKARFAPPTIAAGEADIELTFRLTVVDGLLNDDFTDVTITVLAEEEVLAAVIDGDAVRDVASNTTGVTLDGSRSTGEVVTYEWTVSDDLVELTGADTATPTFTAPFVPYGEDDVDLEVTLKVTDAAANEASATVRISVQAEVEPDGPTVEETQTAIATFMQARAGHLMSAQPDLIGLLSGTKTRSGGATVTQSNGAFNYATSSDQAVWGQVQGNWSTSGDAENSYYFGVVGRHISLTPDAIVGLMFEFDTLTQEDGVTTSEGSGYLAGPYFVGKLPDHALFIEGRYLLGKTENSTSIDGAADQAFDTDRSLASVKVAGQLVYDDLSLTPSLSFTQFTDTQVAFTDNYGRAIAEQGISASEGAIGLDFAKPVTVQNSEVLLTGGVSGIWSATDNDGFASTITSDYEGQRGRLHLGTVYTMQNGIILSADGNYDGLGIEDYQSWGGNLGLTLNF